MRRSAAIIAVLIMLLTVSSCANSEKTAEFFAMDTYMSVKAYGGDAVDEAEALVFELERKLSITDGLSEISAVNEAGSAQVSQETAELVASALGLCELSGGALDISVYPVTRAWGFTAGEYRVPQEAELEKLLRLVDYTKVTVSGDTVITNCCRRATRITFSGKCYDPEAPLSFLAGINDISTVSDTYTIHYRGEVFTDCRVQSFSADDKGGDFFFVSITLMTSEPITPEEEPS